MQPTKARDVPDGTPAKRVIVNRDHASIPDRVRMTSGISARGAGDVVQGR
jgi:hypothetical protein